MSQQSDEQSCTGQPSTCSLALDNCRAAQPCCHPSPRTLPPPPPLFLPAQVLYGVNQRLRVEDVDSPLVAQRPVKSVALVVVTGDRGLCGGYNK